MPKEKNTLTTIDSEMAAKGFASEKVIHRSSDNKTRIKQFQSIRTSERSGEKRASHRPSLIAGFPGAGLVGSISANFIIERSEMHQIASVDSEFILPTVTFIGKKLRHPFRIYADSKGLLYVVVCEAPLIPEGIHSIMDLIVEWAIKNGIGEVITLDGIPVNDWPGKNREPTILTSYYLDDQRRPLTESRDGKDGEGHDSSGGHNKTTLIAGMSAGLLASCMSSDIMCTAVLIPTSTGVPDPEGAAILIEAISAMPNVPLELDTGPLLKEGEEIKRRLGETIESLRQQENSKKGPYPGRSGMYG